MDQNQIRGVSATPSVSALQLDPFLAITSGTTTFTSSATPSGEVLVFRNGLLQLASADYLCPACVTTPTGPVTVTLNAAQAGDNVALVYLVP